MRELGRVELARSLKHRAKSALNLRSVKQALTGAVSFIQRCDSSLRLNVHFHVLALDGVYVREDPAAPLVFHALAEPSADEVAEVAKWTALRVQKILVRQGRTLDGAGERDAHEAQGAEQLAQVAIPARDRARLERLCRYVCRPPIAQDRLEEHKSGKLEYALKKPWKDGTVALLLEPLDLIARTCALVPPPRQHMVGYHGLLSSHARLRSEVVPAPDVGVRAALHLGGRMGELPDRPSSPRTRFVLVRG